MIFYLLNNLYGEYMCKATIAYLRRVWKSYQYPQISGQPNQLHKN